jgi:UDP-N-acetylglucosamine transferase subunit ALG13
MASQAGARLVYVETMARITNPSMTGRVLSRLAGDVLVQWPEMAEVYPGAEVCRPALLETIGVPAGEGRGTFVAVGTWREPFDRLLEMVDDAVRDGVLPGPVHAQTGVSAYRPRHYLAEPHLEPDELERAIAGAEVVICHAGSGIVSGSLRAGRRPLVLPRLREHGEHVDDHQVQIAGKLAEYGLARILGDEITREDLLAAGEPLPRALPASVGRPLEGVLAEILRAPRLPASERGLAAA